MIEKVKIRLKPGFGPGVYDDGVHRICLLPAPDPDFEAPEGYEVQSGEFDLPASVTNALLRTECYEEI